MGATLASAADLSIGVRRAFGDLGSAGPNMGPLIIRIGFWGHIKPIVYLGPYITSLDISGFTKLKTEQLDSCDARQKGGGRSCTLAAPRVCPKPKTLNAGLGFRV